MTSRSKFAWLAIVFFTGCASPPTDIRFELVPPPSVGGPHPNRSHAPLVTLEEFQRFDRMPLHIVSEKGAGSSTTGARKVVIRLSDSDTEVTIKTKNFPPFLDGLNNSPRKELAAYAIQRFFLDPIDYVVPTYGVRCTPLETWEKSNSGLPVTLDGTECALISYAFWLQDVTLPDPLYDEQRFSTDARYAYNLGNFNILTYLISHHDNRLGNFLVSKNEEDRRVFAIDNGTSFGAFLFNWFYPPNMSWRKIKVPALPMSAVNRLRNLKERDLDTLGVVLQLEADSDGILRIEKPGEPIDEEDGVSVHDTTIQLGLTDDEIEDVWERIEDLLADIDDGKIGTF